MSAQARVVRTVLGDIAPEALGVTASHEHLYCNQHLCRTPKFPRKADLMQLLDVDLGVLGGEGLLQLDDGEALAVGEQSLGKTLFLDVPQGRRWVMGYWAQTPEGNRWVSDHWAAEGERDNQYVPEPPTVQDQGPTTAAPAFTSAFGRPMRREAPPARTAMPSIYCGPAT